MTVLGNVLAFISQLEEGDGFDDRVPVTQSLELPSVDKDSSLGEVLAFIRGARSSDADGDDSASCIVTWTPADAANRKVRLPEVWV